MIPCRLQPVLPPPRNRTCPQPASLSPSSVPPEKAAPSLSALATGSLAWELFRSLFRHASEMPALTGGDRWCTIASHPELAGSRKRVLPFVRRANRSERSACVYCRSAMGQHHAGMTEGTMCVVLLRGGLQMKKPRDSKVNYLPV